MDLRNALQKRLGRISLKYAILFTLINTFFLLVFKDIFIRILLFLICAALIFFFGRLPVIDLDPVPFISGIHFLFYGYISTIQFIVWTIPAADVIGNRFNQWSFVNFASLAVALSAIVIFDSIIGLHDIIILSLILIAHNLVRSIITLRMTGGNIQELKAPITNTIAYLIIINVFSNLFLN